MRISMGIAWLVIVAAEMLVGGTGIGYFVWNEWNNLNLANVIFAILTIGVVGMAARPRHRATAEARDLRGLAHGLPRSTGPLENLPGEGRQAGAGVRARSTSRSSRASSSASSATRAAARPPSSTSSPGLDTRERGHGDHGPPRGRGPERSTAAWCSRGHALMPWLSVMSNIAFAVKLALAGLEPHPGRRCTARSSSTWSASPARSTRSRRSSPAA